MRVGGHLWWASEDVVVEAKGKKSLGLMLVGEVKHGQRVPCTVFNHTVPVPLYCVYTKKNG
jgi:hypothetical protein